MINLTIEDEDRYVLPETLQDEVRRKIKEAQASYNAYYDINLQKNVIFDVKDIIYMKNALSAPGESTKFREKLKGPLVAITRMLPADIYGIASLRKDGRCRIHALTAHASQLKLWRASDSDDLITFDSDPDNPEDKDPAEDQKDSKNNDVQESSEESETEIDNGIRLRPRNSIKRPNRFGCDN